MNYTIYKHADWENEMRTLFIGRSRELSELNRLYQSQKAEFLILYGRRRIGKTRLLTHWMETSKPRAFFWVAEPTSSFDQLRSFSQAVFRFESPQSQPPLDMSYGDWRTAFETLARLAEKERTVVIIDEFTYLLEAEPAVSAYLQHAWDHVSKSDQPVFDYLRFSPGDDATAGFVLPGSIVWAIHCQSAFAAAAIRCHPGFLSKLSSR